MGNRRNSTEYPSMRWVAKLKKSLEGIDGIMQKRQLDYDYDVMPATISTEAAGLRLTGFDMKRMAFRIMRCRLQHWIEATQMTRGVG